ncbi:MAG: alpha/beta hydrolase [Eubacteriales bacterium]|nr:alpha/beta hydrolase [Eubacteriales bacterium]
MIKREEKKFKSSSGLCNIHVVLWHPDKEQFDKPVGIVQIAHGMVDHIERFEEMAEYFALKGFIVAGSDHLGHGDSVVCKDDWGYFAEGNNSGDYLIKDLHRLTTIMKAQYPELPYILIGHSMGSFICRKYATVYGEDLDGVIFLGTGNQSRIKVESGKILAMIIRQFKGERYRSVILDKLTFGMYNKRISGKRTDKDWLTKDETIVNKYISDEKCSYIFTTNAYIALMNIIKYDINEKNIKKTPKELPVLFAAGKEDPVGNYGKDVEKVYRIYKKNLNDVKLKLYENNRHELHSETNRDEVFNDLYDWITRVISE